jgi:hypothetical protein
LQAKVEKYQDATEELDQMLTRSTNLLDAILINNGKYYQDMFTYLHEQDAWTTTSSDTNMTKRMLRTCVSELSLDYCQRFSKNAANALVDDMMAQGKSVEDIMAMNNVEQVLLDRIGQDEPYCVLLDQCIVSNFVDPTCQPRQCPFPNNQAACQYLTSCLNPSLQKEYERALRKTATNTTTATRTTDAEPKSETKQNPTKKKKTWGF